MSVQLAKSEAKRFAVEFEDTVFRACLDCTISEDNTDRGNVRPRGDIRAPVVIVGEAPGEEEVQRQQAFVGRSGKLLHKSLKRYGFDTDTDAYVTNTVKCRPQANRSPTAKECRECRGKFLVNEIKLFDRKLIIALGNYGYYGIVPKGSPSGIMKRHGMFEWNDEFECYVLPCIHPAAVLRNPASDKLLREALIKCARFIRNGYKLDDTKPVDYKDIFSISAFHEFVAEVKKRKQMVFDLETTGFSWITDKILCMTFSTKAFSAWYLPLHWNEQFVWDKSDWDTIQEGLRELFEDPSIRKMAFNAKFDLKFLIAHFGWDIRGRVDDPMLMHHLIEENTPHGLKPLASRYTTMGDYSRPLEEAFNVVKRSRIPKEDKHYGKIPSEILKPYALMDADATWRVYDRFLPMLKGCEASPRLFQFYRKCVMPVADVLMDMEMTGILVDRARIEELRTEFRQNLTDGQSRFNTLAGQDVNINSYKQLSEYLFGAGGYTPIKPGKSYPSTDEGVLKELQKKYSDEKFEILLEYRHNKKLLSTYVDGLAKQITPDGRIHTTYLVHGTATGRLSSVQPNLQNIPRDSVIKSLFVPTPGWQLLDADFSQHEVRMWANYSQDQKLIMALTTGDVHSNIGAQLLEKPADQITKEERVFVKGVVFGLMFGRGSSSLAAGLGETLKKPVAEYEAQRFIRLFFSMFPVASEWLIKQEKFAMNNAYVRNLFGRVRRLPEVNAKNDPGLMAEARRNARNSPIQSLASDVTNLALIRIRSAFRQAGLTARLLLQVHDEIVAEAPKEEIEEALEIMKDQMLVPPPRITVPLAIEIKIVDRWGGESIKEVKAQWQT